MYESVPFNSFCPSIISYLNGNLNTETSWPFRGDVMVLRNGMTHPITNDNATMSLPDKTNTNPSCCKLDISGMYLFAEVFALELQLK